MSVPLDRRQYYVSWTSLRAQDVRPGMVAGVPEPGRLPGLSWWADVFDVIDCSRTTVEDWVAAQGREEWPFLQPRDSVLGTNWNHQDWRYLVLLQPGTSVNDGRDRTTDTWVWQIRRYHRYEVVDVQMLVPLEHDLLAPENNSSRSC